MPGFPSLRRPKLSTRVSPVSEPRHHSCTAVSTCVTVEGCGHEAGLWKTLRCNVGEDGEEGLRALQCKGVETGKEEPVVCWLAARLGPSALRAAESLQ